MRHRQDDAIALARLPAIRVTGVVMLRTVGMLVTCDMSGVMHGRGNNSLKEVVHSMRRGSGEKKPKRGADAQA